MGCGYSDSMLSIDGTSPSPSRASRVRACLLGGAIGDALGAPVEFASLSEIRRRHGPAGVIGFARGEVGRFTDDTQMTLFTAEGLICAAIPGAGRDKPEVSVAVWHAYQRWLDTQGYSVSREESSPGRASGWLMREPSLRHRRAPGATCISALSAGRPGSIHSPVNDSKGCGGVMRVAPIGLVAEDAFDLGCAAAALTHGHPSGYLAAGAFAQIVAEVSKGQSLTFAIRTALELLAPMPGAHETKERLDAAVELAKTGPEPSGELIESLGGGWVAEEALAITVYCCLVASDFRTAVLLAVNHSGDSDSTGAMVGNLMGAAGGYDALPAEWVGHTEAVPIIERIAQDLLAATNPGHPLTSERLAQYGSW